MYNQNDRDPYNRQTHRDDYTHRQGADRSAVENNRQDANDYQVINQTPTAANGTPVSPVENSYQRGYVQGRIVDRRDQEVLQARENESATNGFLIGILLTSIVGIVIAALYFIYQQSQAPAPVVPVPVPTQSNPSETQDNNTEIRERIIERTREVVPIPQPQAPAPTNEQPEVAPQPPAVEQPAVEQPSVEQPQPPAVTQPDAQVEQSAPASPTPQSPIPQGAAQ
ncbi:MAG TPA: hypothetical protein DEV81_01030 [Cyanobacteria bacterium UBA11049]|nr:hypothetical protein [Cyanobacteria bacterium UBA11049]